MPSRTTFVLCHCRECRTKSPNGQSFPQSQLNAHLAGVQARFHATSPANQSEDSPNQEEVEAASAQLLALTLTDEGPDATSQPSRLWTSRTTFQQRSSSHRLPEQSAYSPVQAIVDGVAHLSISHTKPQTQEPVASTDPKNIEGRSQRPRNSPAAGSEEARLLLKRERNRHTGRASGRFDAISLHISACREKLVSVPSNEVLRDVESEVTSLRSSLEAIKRRTPSLDQRRKEISESLEKLEARIIELKVLVPDLAKKPLQYACDHHYQTPVDRADELAQISMFLAVVCAVIMGISRRAGDFVMGLVSLILHTALRKKDGTLNPSHENTLSQIPLSLAAALSNFNLDGRVTIYAVCPACHCTYQPQYKPGSTLAIYPQQCTNKSKPESDPCNEPLLRTRSDDDARTEPIKTFVYHNFMDYLAGLLSRGDIEAIMDKACDDTMESLSGSGPEFVKNIFDAEFLRSFEGPDSKPGKRILFIDRRGEGRYIFSLNIDFFHPESMHIRGATTSCGIISMACLNLPLDICYKPENMYLAGIITGPREPHHTQLNHYMRPLMDDMVVCWEDGVHFTRTALYPTGRMTRSAVVAAVCDLPAARKSAQLAGHSSHFYCSVCQCWHKDTIGRSDCEAWTRRDNDELRQHAKQWRDAHTSKEQEKIFNTYGVRWSELWRLPYWEPSRQLVVDSMHCILEGLVQYHARDVLGLTTSSAVSSLPVLPAFSHTFSEPGPNATNLTAKEVKQVSQIHILLTALVEGGDDMGVINQNLELLKDNLLRKNKKSLEFVCRDLRRLPPTSLCRIYKIEFATALVDWRRDKPLTSDSPQPLKIVTPDVLQRIKDVVKNTVTPSWLDSVPYNFGDAAAGTLKADEWRTMSTIYLPLALVSIWGVGTPHPTPSIAAKLQQILDHSMALFSAVRLACMRTMTTSRMIWYRNYMTTYVRDLKELHPDANHKVNHHMAQHIYDFLLLFGPVRSWWCFPFERLIGILQRLPNNHKFGQLEPTMLQTFIRGARLRRWLSRPDCPPTIKECKRLFDKAYAPRGDDYAGPENDDAFNAQTSTSTLQVIPDALSSLVKERKAAFRSRFRHHGVVYATSSTHLGNSLVNFYPNGRTTSLPIPGCIEYIFSQEGSIVFAVRRQLAAVETIDPFEPYVHFPAKLYSSNLAEKLEIIQVQWVMGHFARWPISSNNVVVLSLGRD